MFGTIIRLFSGASGIVRAAAGGWQIYAGILAVGVAIGGAGAYKIMDWRMQAAEAAHDKALAEQLAKTVLVERQMTEASGKAEAALQTARANVQVITKTITKQVPVYVSAQDDARCAIPVGFVRLHDAAAAGRALPDVPGPAGGADGGASGVALSAVASTVAANYGTYAEVVAQLKAFQQWARDQQAVRSAP